MFSRSLGPRSQRRQKACWRGVATEPCENAVPSRLKGWLARRERISLLRRQRRRVLFWQDPSRTPGWGHCGELGILKFDLKRFVLASPLPNSWMGPPQCSGGMLRGLRSDPRQTVRWCGLAAERPPPASAAVSRVEPAALAMREGERGQVAAPAGSAKSAGGLGARPALEASRVPSSNAVCVARVCRGITAVYGSELS